MRLSGIFNDRAYLLIFHKARAAAFTGQEAGSLLARRPYDLRHAAVSTQRRVLNSWMALEGLAQWPTRFLTGHFVAVLAVKPRALPVSVPCR